MNSRQMIVDDQSTSIADDQAQESTLKELSAIVRCCKAKWDSLVGLTHTAKFRIFEAINAMRYQQSRLLFGFLEAMGECVW